MSLKNIIRHSLFAVILASLILAACAPPATKTAEVKPPTQPAAVQPTAVPTKPPERKVATIIWTQEYDNLSPLYTNMWFVSTTYQVWNCYAWDFDDQLNTVPVLVKEMPTIENGGITDGGKVITMKLRDDIVWSDGTPITSEDFIFTYQMTMDPKNTVSSTSPYDMLEKMEAPDAQTVVMTFKEPYAPWVGSLWKGIIPAHVLKSVYEKEGTLDNAEWNRAPTVGCGPFNFAEWESGSFARFVANDKYWLGRPKLDEIFFRFVPDDASQVAALKAGDGDIGAFIPQQNVPELEAAGVQMKTVFSGFNEMWYFYLDPTKGNPAILDVRVRQALAYGLDRFTIDKDLLLGLTEPAATYWDETPYVDPSLKAWPYDPEKAKALLDEAGWKDTNGDGVRDKDGVELVLTFGTTTRQIRQQVQAVTQQQLAQIGIKLDLLNYDSDIFFSGYGQGGPAATGQLDIFEYSNSTHFPDPDTAEWLCSEIPSTERPEGLNWSAVCDVELDQLFKLQATQVDFKERQQTFYKISKIIFEKVYMLGIWHDPDLWAISKRLLNVKFSGATPFYNVMDWDIAQ
jgi:peptide/nickel transport system substrate-binding protein